MTKNIVRDCVKFIVLFGLFFILAVAYVKNDLRIFALGFAGSVVLLSKKSLWISVIFIAASSIAMFNFADIATNIVYIAILIVGKQVSKKLKLTHNAALSTFYFIIGCLPKFFFTFGKDNIPSGVIFILLSTGVFVSSFIFCSAALRRKMYLKLTVDEIACGLVVVVGCFCGLFHLSQTKIDFVRFVAVLILLISIYCELDSLALCLGSVFGVGILLAGGSVGYIAMFSVMAILIKLFKSDIRIFAALSCVCLDIVFGLYFDVFDNYTLYNLISSILAGGVFMILPQKTFDYIVVNYSKPSAKMAYKSIINQNSSEISKKLLELSEVFFDIDLGFRKLVRGALPLDQSKKMFVREVCDSCCRDCDNYVECHRKRQSDTQEVFMSLADNGFEKGKITLLELPPYLTSNCNKINMMLPTINGLINQYKKNAQVIALEDDSKILVAEQLRGVSKLLYNLSQTASEKLVFDTKKEVEIIDALTYSDIICCEASVYVKSKDCFKVGIVIRKEDLQNDKLIPSIEKVCKHKLVTTEITPALVSGLVVMSLESAPKYDVVFGLARASKDNAESCGDNYSMLKVGNNKFLMAICDGMGSGESASNISQKASFLIENFYRADFDSEIILSSINKLLNLQRDENFSTIDICVVDLATSIVDFVKLGATASFIKHQDTITKIESGALPVGILDEISPKITKTSVNYGDMIILTSDGITDSFGEEELERFVLENQSLSPQELADNILTKAKALCGGMPIDDMTVLIGKIFKNHQ